jgi:hypothetical protein
VAPWPSLERLQTLGDDASGHLQHPAGLASDGGGLLFVASQGTGEVLAWDLTGKGKTTEEDLMGKGTNTAMEEEASQGAGGQGRKPATREGAQGSYNKAKTRGSDGKAQGSSQDDDHDMVVPAVFVGVVANVGLDDDLEDLALSYC